jgi:hypothetical protein
LTPLPLFESVDFLFKQCNPAGQELYTLSRRGEGGGVGP